MGHPGAMAITLPIGIRVVAGLLGTAIDRITKLPEELPTIGITLVGQVFKTSLRLRQEVAELATRGDDLLSGITGGAQENPPWATFDEDEDDMSSERPASTDRSDPGPGAAVPAPVSPPVPSPGPVPGMAPGAPVGGRRRTSKDVPVLPPMPSRVVPPSDAPPGTPSRSLVGNGARSGTSPRTVSASAAKSGAARKPRSKVVSTGSPGGPRTTAAEPPSRVGVRSPHSSGVNLSDGQSIGPDHQLSVAELKERLLAVDLSVVMALLTQEEAGPQRAAFLTLLSNRMTTLQHEHR